MSKPEITRVHVPRKYYVIEKCGDVIWMQKQMTFLEFEKVKDAFIAFLVGLNPDQVDLVTALNQFLDVNIREAVNAVTVPYRHEHFFSRIRQSYLIWKNDIDTDHPLDYMALSELGVIVNDFFSLNRSWTQELNGSAENWGGILTDLMEKMTVTTLHQDQPRSSGSSQTDETKSSKS